MSLTTFRGLPTTLLGLAFLYFVGAYAELTLEVAGRGPIVEADTRLSNLLYVFRDDASVRFFSIVTGLGQWRAMI